MPRLGFTTELPIDFREDDHVMIARQDAGTLEVWGYEYTPATPNPPGEAETYSPVHLVWHHDPSGFGNLATGKHGNRVYRLTSQNCGRVFMLSVNGVHIPVTFPSPRHVALFAQQVEDANTED